MTSSASYYYSGSEEDYEPHFLDCCSLCNRSLNHNSDIYMYRGNTPFCSQECRQEQIEIDEANDKKWKRSSKESSKKSARQSSEAKEEFDAKKSVAVA